MKKSSYILVGFLAISVIVFGFCDSAYGQTENVALLLQQTPLNGGTVEPGVGVHHFDIEAIAVLTAVPKPGFQFVYWLGDVSDAASSRTTVYLNSPKIVIAVFEQVVQEVLLSNELSISRPGGGMSPTAGDYSNQGYSGGGRKRPHKWRWPTPPEPPEPESDPLPVPREENEIPVPESIPEPATALLTGLGSLLVFTRRRMKK